MFIVINKTFETFVQHKIQIQVVVLR
jgi:hypothetical protein